MFLIVVECCYSRINSTGAGRYLDLEEAHDKTPIGNWVLDFNKAYNPFCAYNHDYACALTPFENHLKVAIPVGEKVLHAD
jgi:hypothetical protein